MPIDGGGPRDQLRAVRARRRTGGRTSRPTITIRRRTSSSSSNTDAQPGLGMNFPMRTLHYNPAQRAGRTVERLRDARGDVQRVRPGRRAAQHLPRRAAEELRHRPDRERSRRQSARLHDQHHERDAGDRGRGAALQQVLAACRTSPDGNSQPNDFPFFRLAEMYLIKAEALNELGQTRRGDRAGEPHPCSRSSARRSRSRRGCRRRRRATAIFNERLFELTGEGEASVGHDPRRHVHRRAALQGVDAGVQDPVPDPADADRIQPAARRRTPATEPDCRLVKLHGVILPGSAVQLRESQRRAPHARVARSAPWKSAAAPRTFPPVVPPIPHDVALCSPAASRVRWRDVSLPACSPPAPDDAESATASPAASCPPVANQLFTLLPSSVHGRAVRESAVESRRRSTSSRTATSTTAAASRSATSPATGCRRSC